MKNSQEDVADLFNKSTAGLLESSGELLPSAGTRDLLSLMEDIVHLQDRLLSNQENEYDKKVIADALALLKPFAQDLKNKIMKKVDAFGGYHVLSEAQPSDKSSQKRITVSIDSQFNGDINANESEYWITLTSDDWGNEAVEGPAIFKLKQNTFKFLDTFSKDIKDKGLRVADIAEILKEYPSRPIGKVSILVRDSTGNKPDTLELVRNGINEEGYDVYVDAGGNEYMLADKMYKVEGAYIEIYPVAEEYTIVNKFTVGEQLTSDADNPLAEKSEQEGYPITSSDEMRENNGEDQPQGEIKTQK